MINHYAKRYDNTNRVKYALWGRDTKLPLHMLGCDVYLYPTAMEIKFPDGNSKYEFTDNRSIMQYLAKAKHYKGLSIAYGLGKPVYIGYGKISNYLSEVMP